MSNLALDSEEGAELVLTQESFPSCLQCARMRKSSLLAIALLLVGVVVMFDGSAAVDMPWLTVKQGNDRYFIADDQGREVKSLLLLTPPPPLKGKLTPRSPRSTHRRSCAART